MFGAWAGAGGLRLLFCLGFALGEGPSPWLFAFDWFVDVGAGSSRRPGADLDLSTLVFFASCFVVLAASHGTHGISVKERPPARTRGLTLSGWVQQTKRAAPRA